MPALYWLMATALNMAIAIDHPQPDDFPPHVADLLRQTRLAFDAAPQPGSAEYGELGMVYHAHGLQSASRQAYQAAAQAAPDDFRWPYLLALIDADEGRFELAAEGLAHSLSLNPQFVPALVRLARARFSLGQLEAAKDLLEQAVERQPSLAAARAHLGVLYQALGKPEQAVTQLEAALAAQPEANSLYAPLGMAYRATGQAARAKKVLSMAGQREVVLDDPLEQAVRARSGSVSYFLTLGVNAAENDDLRGALAYLRRALDIDPDNVNVLVTVARVLESEGDISEAVIHADRALQLAPDYPLALEQRGVLHEISADPRRAMAYYRQALAADPALADARQLLANGLMREQRYAEAIPHLELLLGAQPSPSLVLKLAAAHYENGACREAAGTLDSALRERASEDLLVALSRIAATCEEVSPTIVLRAATALRGLVEARPSLALMTSLAMLEMSQRNQDQAVALQREAATMAQAAGAPSEVVNQLAAQAKRFEAGLQPQRAWREDHPAARPPLLRAGDR